MIPLSPMHTLSPRTGSLRRAAPGGFSRASQERAFTLVELLASIAIIAILTILAISGAGKMIERAHSLTCVSNLRQLSSALLLNAADNNGELLPGRDVGSGVIWTGALNAGNYISVPYLVNWQQMDCKAPIYCPSEKIHHGYGDYGPTTDHPFGPNNRRLVSVTQPAKKVMICEARTPNSSASDPWRGTWSSWPAGAGWVQKIPWPFRHGEIIHMAFFDGHVESRTRTSLIPDSARKEIFDNIYQEGW